MADPNWKPWIAPDGSKHDSPPNYPGDLNAMNEAEITADLYSYPRRERYLGHLQDIINAEGIERPFMCAAAAQRAEAFLKTLGLWEDEAPTQLTTAANT
jgi:hypothetical protein